LEAARAYRDDGQSVFPVRRDGSKAPAVDTWIPYQERLPTEAELIDWYDRPDPPGIATVAGKVSGNSEHIDFDQKADVIFPEWRELVRSERPDLWPKLCVIRTPRQPSGFHIKYKCSGVQIPGNHRLAKDPGLPKNKQVLIETRGEGGYTVAPGSPACCHENKAVYEHVEGPPPWALATIAAGEREILLLSARSFNREPAEERTATASRTEAPGDCGRPGDDYNANGPPFAEIMVPHGWTVARESNGVQYLRRPGKERGWSGTVGYCTSKTGVPLFACFSDNADPFAGMVGGKPSCYSRFAVYALLNHGGDYSAAAKALYGRASNNGSKKSNAPDSRDSPVWGDPVPLGDLPAPMPFPLEVLPDPVRRLAKESAWANNCPPDFIGVQALALAGGAIANSRRLLIKGTHIQSACLYAGIVCRPGTGKTPSAETLHAPFIKRQREMIDAWRKELEEWKKAGEKEKGKEKQDRGPKPICPRIYIEDTTTESAKIVLAENDRGVMGIYDEMSFLWSGMNQFKGGKGNDRQFYTQIWSHKAICNDRKSDKDRDGGPLFIPRPFMGIIGTIQPRTLDTVHSSGTDHKRWERPPDDGYLDRFLLSFPDPPPQVEEDWKAISNAAVIDWGDIIDKLLSLRMTKDEDDDDDHPKPALVYLTRDGGRMAWQRFTAAHAAEMNAADFPDHLFGPWAKLKGYAGRLALIVHFLRWACEEVKSENVDAESMDRAARLVDYFKQHARRALAVMGADHRLGDAKVIWDWVVREKRKTFKRWEAHKDLKSESRFPAPDKMDKPLELLCQHNLIRAKDPPPRPGPGQKAATEFEVNPVAARRENRVNPPDAP
jgi:hypothetical protein